MTVRELLHVIETEFGAFLDVPVYVELREPDRDSGYEAAETVNVVDLPFGCGVHPCPELPLVGPRGGKQRSRYHTHDRRVLRLRS